MASATQDVKPALEQFGFPDEDKVNVSGGAPRDNYERALRKLNEYYQDGEVTEADYLAIGEFVLAHDPEQFNFPGEERSNNTLRSYARMLTHVALRSPKPLVDMTAREVNNLMAAYQNGDAKDIKDGGLSGNTVRLYQNVLRSFYEYHEDLLVEKSEISLKKLDRDSVDKNDVLSEQQVADLRDAINNSRDRALFEFLYNTGMRLRVVQALKIKHFELEAGQFVMPDVEGLKGAREIMRKRSLFGATGAIRRWLQDHPTGEEDHYLFTTRPGTGRGSPETQMSHNAINQALHRVAERAGYDPRKGGDIKVNPHNFRHTWVTRARLEWELSDSEIKKHLGHRPDSNIMEVTYSHLSDENWIDRMEQKVGIAEPDEEDDTPKFKTCGNCGERLDHKAKACPACGIALSPDAVAAKQGLHQDIGASKALSEELVKEAIEKIENDEELMAKMIELKSEQ